MSKTGQGKTLEALVAGSAWEQVIGWRLSPVPCAGPTCGLVASLVENKEFSSPTNTF